MTPPLHYTSDLRRHAPHLSAELEALVDRLLNAVVTDDTEGDDDRAASAVRPTRTAGSEGEELEGLGGTGAVLDASDGRRKGVGGGATLERLLAWRPVRRRLEAAWYFAENLRIRADVVRAQESIAARERDVAARERVLELAERQLAEREAAATALYHRLDDCKASLKKWCASVDRKQAAAVLLLPPRPQHGPAAAAAADPGVTPPRADGGPCLAREVDAELEGATLDRRALESHRECRCMVEEGRPSTPRSDADAPGIAAFALSSLYREDEVGTLSSLEALEGILSDIDIEGLLHAPAPSPGAAYAPPAYGERERVRIAGGAEGTTDSTATTDACASLPYGPSIGGGVSTTGSERVVHRASYQTLFRDTPSTMGSGSGSGTTDGL